MSIVIEKEGDASAYSFPDVLRARGIIETPPEQSENGLSVLTRAASNSQVAPLQITPNRRRKRTGSLDSKKFEEETDFHATKLDRVTGNFYRQIHVSVVCKPTKWIP